MYYLIVNLNAGKQKTLKKLQIIKNIIESSSKSCEEHILYQGKDDKQIICSHLKNAKHTDAVIIFGGDGTVSKVINWLLEDNISVPIGIIPLGTCNDFSGVLGLGNTVEEQMKTIINGETIPVDLGLYKTGSQNRYFVCCYEAGQLSFVSYGTPDRMKKHFKVSAYYFVFLKQLLCLHEFYIKIQTEDRTFEGNVFGALILNGHKFGGFHNISKGADVSDGKMNLVLLTGKKRRIVGTLFKLLTGKTESCSDIKQFDFKQIAIETNARVDTMVDGDEGDALPKQIDVIKGAVQIFAKRHNSHT